MKKFTIFFLAAFLLLGAVSKADALYGLVKYWGAVYDENGNIRTDATEVAVYTIDTTTAATVYSDNQGTSLTNPIVSGLSDGVFEFWSATSSFDILVQAGSRAVLFEDWTTSSKHRVVIASQAKIDRLIRFWPGDFVALDVAGTTVVPLTATSTPRLSVDNSLIAMEWDDGDESYAQVTFKVPLDYLQGGAFRVFSDYDAGSDHPQIHYRVYINGDGSVWDTTTTAQTAVDPAGTAGTPELTNLSIATDFASLAAGDIVTFQVTRSDQESGVTADLEIYYVEFYYVGKQ